MAKHVFTVEIQAPDELPKRDVKEFVVDAVKSEPGHYDKSDPYFHIRLIRITATKNDDKR